MTHSRTLSSIGEEGLIHRLARRIRTDREVLKGIGDDCAVLKLHGSRNHLLFASDMLLEGVHFKSNAAAAAVGWKALAVNLSDIAAMGGIPRYAVISVGFPPTAPISFVDQLYEGLMRCARMFRVNLVGGDTNRSSRVVIDVAILGYVEPARIVYRSGARVGDAVFVTGRLGGAVESGRHLTFTPRLREARALGSRVCLHAMIDLSDGLGNDLTRLCHASGVAACLDAGSIPCRRGSSLKQALTDGEDFELLFTVNQREATRLVSWARKNLPCGLHRIGRILPRRPGSPIQILSSDGRPLRINRRGFQHFG